MTKHFQSIQTRGFSLMELLVVMTIFSLISLIVLANHAKFNSSVLLGSLAYDIGLSVREAQVYGLSVQGQSGTNFQVGYGVHFAGSTTYILFADLNANKKYDTGVDTIVKTYSVGQQHSVKKFCGARSTGVTDCSDGSSGSVISSLDVVFYRPEPDANIVSNLFSPYSSANIQVASPSGETRSITIASTGQIAVANP